MNTTASIWGRGDRTDHRSARRSGEVFITALFVLTFSTRALADPRDTKSESDALFYEGKARLDRGEVSEACDKLEQSLALLRRGGTLLALALCRELIDKPAAALPLFEEAEEVASHDGHAERQAIARQHIDALRSRLSWIAMTLDPSADVPGLAITLDGTVVPRSKWYSRIPVAPGAHRVIATAPERERFEIGVAVERAGETRDVRISLQAIRAEPLIAQKDVMRAAPAPTPASDLTHRLQLGAIARVDVDPIHPGARAAAGLTFGIDSHFEVGASALLGRDMGLEPQLNVYMMRSAWKPLVSAAVPIFFVDGARVGLRTSAGIAWDANRHVGVFALVGAAFFANAAPGYAHAVFLPSLGVQGRI